MQAYEAGVVGRGRDSERFGISGVEAGSMGIGRAREYSWNGGQPEQANVWSRTGRAMRAVMRLAIPVLALLVILAASYLYRSVKIEQLSAIAPWLTLGHALIALPFLAVMLTNRRFGPSYALAQVTICMGIIGSVTVADAASLATLVPHDAAVPERTVIAFACAFFLSNLAGIITFDASRGPRWWTAPLVAAVFSAMVFAGVFYPAAFMGTELDWMNHMVVEAALMAVAGLCLLIPYWFLRPVVTPLAGYNGY